MKTKQAYFEDTYRFEGESEIIEICDFNGSTGIILASTIFYPQGGGQACDTGKLQCQGRTFNVEKVVWQDGEIVHFCKDDLMVCKGLVGQACKMMIESEKRLKHAKLHSGGHLIDDLIKKELPHLQVTKGHHFPGQSYLTLEGKVDDLPALVEQLNGFITQQIDARLNFRCRLEEVSSLASLIEKLPYEVPKDKPLRVAQIGESLPVPCGGTHVKNSQELKGLSVSKAKRKSGSIKISYTI